MALKADQSRREGSLLDGLARVLTLEIRREPVIFREMLHVFLGAHVGHGECWWKTTRWIGFTIAVKLCPSALVTKNFGGPPQNPPTWLVSSYTRRSCHEPFPPLSGPGLVLFVQGRLWHFRRHLVSASQPKHAVCYRFLPCPSLSLDWLSGGLAFKGRMVQGTRCFIATFLTKILAIGHISKQALKPSGLQGGYGVPQN